jgi:hypothetical protein
MGGDRDYQIDRKKKSGNMIHYMFLLCGFGFHNQFGGPEPDLKLRRGGTRDSGLRVTRNGREFLIIPKVNDYKGFDERLRLPEGTIIPDAIYVAARYHNPPVDDCEMVGWEFGSKLLAERDLRMWTHQLNYTKAYVALPHMKDLTGES